MSVGVPTASFLRLVVSWEAVCARRREGKHFEADRGSLGFLITTYRLGTGVLLLLVPACIRWVVMVSQTGRRVRIRFFIIGSLLPLLPCPRDYCLLFFEGSRGLKALPRLRAPVCWFCIRIPDNIPRRFPLRILAWRGLRSGLAM